MKINILNDIPLDMPFFQEEELVWINKHFIVSDDTLINQSSYIVEEAVNWLTHLLHAASMNKAMWKETESSVDIWTERN